jgi:hypothetical protein
MAVMQRRMQLKTKKNISAIVVKRNSAGRIELLRNRIFSKISPSTWNGLLRNPYSRPEQSMEAVKYVSPKLGGDFKGGAGLSPPILLVLVLQR